MKRHLLVQMVQGVGLVLAVFVASQIVFDTLGGVSTRSSQVRAELRKLMKDLFVAFISVRNAEPFGDGISGGLISDSFNSAPIS